jgi:hypothetical protein
VRFVYEWHDDSQNWFRSYGNENWEFNAQGLMPMRHPSIDDTPIREAERLFRWPLAGVRANILGSATSTSAFDQTRRRATVGWQSNACGLPPLTKESQPKEFDRAKTAGILRTRGGSR